MEMLPRRELLLARIVPTTLCMIWVTQLAKNKAPPRLPPCPLLPLVPLRRNLGTNTLLHQGNIIIPIRIIDIDTKRSLLKFSVLLLDAWNKLQLSSLLLPHPIALVLVAGIVIALIIIIITTIITPIITAIIMTASIVIAKLLIPSAAWRKTNCNSAVQCVRFSVCRLLWVSTKMRTNNNGRNS